MIFTAALVGARLRLFCPFALPAFLLAGPQAAPPEGFQHWTPASLRPVEQKLAAQAASDPHRFAVQELADYPNEYFVLVRREADGAPEWHKTQIDILVVQSGTATPLIGGDYLSGETVAPHEKRNGTIQGGERVNLSPGDVVRIPPRTPHQIFLNGGHEFTYLVVKGKRY